MTTWFLTFHSYGTWLPGDRRGWTLRGTRSRRSRRMPEAPRLEVHVARHMTHAAFSFDLETRRTIDRVIREECRRFGWELAALNVRLEHVHAVVSAPESAAKIIHRLKARTTLALHRAGKLEAGRSAWASGYSGTVVDDEGFARVVEYVLHRQGRDLLTDPTRLDRSVRLDPTVPGGAPTIDRPRASLPLAPTDVTAPSPDGADR